MPKKVQNIVVGTINKLPGNPHAKFVFGEVAGKKVRFHFWNLRNLFTEDDRIFFGDKQQSYDLCGGEQVICILREPRQDEDCGHALHWAPRAAADQLKKSTTEGHVENGATEAKLSFDIRAAVDSSNHPDDEIDLGFDPQSKTRYRFKKGEDIITEGTLGELYVQMRQGRTLVGRGITAYRWKKKKWILCKENPMAKAAKIVVMPAQEEEPDETLATVQA